MGYLINPATLAWRCADAQTPPAPGEVYAADAYTEKFGIWDAALQTIRAPTVAEITAAQAAADAAAAVLAQEELDRIELKTKFANIRDGLQAIIDTASFTNATRDAAIVELANDVRFILKVVKGLM